ncbi:hypothetical protein [Peribacillus deserti]|uniref:Uncharacterized protein n=1 Tax=Peribacillus deserti TaxID=673318 RepID=A0A2N5M2K1_9BACI|nr:hypothetical protein [Peribacillus deserti]PLT28545.1 hypothetical protein CUU66_17835 [Peribacillus deserti]
MGTIYEKFDVLSIRDIHRQLNEIQMIARSEQCGSSELACSLDYITKAAGMLCSILEQQLEGKIDVEEPLEYIERSVGEALKAARRLE